jgi:predicted ATPase
MVPSPEPLGPADTEDWSALEHVIKRFVGAWRQGPRPSLDDALRAGGGQHALLVELAHTELELRLKAGEPARAEEYLARYPGLSDDVAAAVDLIAAEYDLRRRGEAHLRPDEFVGRFPQYDAELVKRLARATRDAGDTPGRKPDAGPSAPPEVDGYELLGPLGRGGMGVVYKARQLSLNRLVALKFLPEECTRDSWWLGRFRREGRLASALNHPHICTIYDSGEAAGRPFLSMELIDGQTVEELATRRPPLEEVVRLIRQAARALAAAHAAGVVHRDVKPQNLMVRNDGLVKVLDFGLARRLPAGTAPGPAPSGTGTSPGGAHGTDAGARLGTLLYMSPEQARAEPMGTATDVFSLGVVLYELVAWEHPFEAQTEAGVLQNITGQAPQPPSRMNPDVPSALEGLILRMLAKDPRLRPTAAEVEAVLAELAGGAVGGHGRPPGPGSHPRVGRSEELEALRESFEAAAAGRGSLVCVTGEPGLGKTTLVEGLLEELADSGRLCSVARGRCPERLAGAEAYLPLLKALESLLQGPDGASAAQVMRLVAPTWYAQLATPAGAPAEAKGASQERLKREFYAFLQEVSRLRPLVLFLDDVQWADLSTTDLLAYLGGRCGARRVLVLLAYRPTDLALGRHALGPVKLELQARGLCREVAVGPLGRPDVERYLALRFPGHEFPEEFAALVYRRTEGHPLFLVGLLQYLCDRGALTAAGGRWALARAVPDLQPDLPESVRSLIERKIGRLDEGQHRLLTAASVQGQEFEAAVVARVLGLGAADAEERLAVLHRIHALVRPLREHCFPDGTVTQRYAFAHGLYKNALYAALPPARRAALSAAVADALVGCHGDQSASLAAELALLYEAARDPARAADYFRLAAQGAAGVYAHREAVALARRGLALAADLPDGPERARRELRLLLTLGMQLQVTQGFAAPEVEQTYARARELCHRLQESGPLFAVVLWGLWLFCKVRSELPRARALAEQLRDLAGGLGDPGLTLQSHQALAVTSLCQGIPAETRGQMESAVALYDPQRHRDHAFLYGQDPGVACLAFGAVALWLLGHPGQATRRSAEAVALGRQLGQPSTLALALHFDAMVRQYRREGAAAAESAVAATALSAEHGFSFWRAGGQVLRGWALADQGALADGIAQMRQGIAAWVATGSETYRTYFLSLLAEMLGRAGRAEEGLGVLDEGLSLARRTGERFQEAELHRLRGELLLARPPGKETAREAARCFLEGLAVARGQGARSLELRAATSLARLYRSQGRRPEAKALLAKSCGWFTEGLETPDLRGARALLEELSCE